MGSALSEWLGKYGIEEGIQVSGTAGTGFSIVLAPPGVDRIFLEAIGCNKIFDVFCINFEVVSRSRLFHFGYPPLLERFYKNHGRQLVEMFAEVQKSGVVTSLDFSLPDPDSESSQLNWQGLLSHVLPQVDICAPSLEEALLMLMPEEYARIQSGSDQHDIINQIPLTLVRKLGRKFISFGVKILLIKAAHRGAYLLCGDISSLNQKLGNTLDEEKWSHSELWCDAWPVEEARVENAIGAGDTAIAAFLSAILDGNGPLNSIKYACLAGRNSLYCNNLYEELRDWEEMKLEITKGGTPVGSFNKQDFYAE